MENQLSLGCRWLKVTLSIELILHHIVCPFCETHSLLFNDLPIPKQTFLKLSKLIWNSQPKMLCGSQRRTVIQTHDGICGHICQIFVLHAWIKNKLNEILISLQLVVVRWLFFPPGAKRTVTEILKHTVQSSGCHHLGMFDFSEVPSRNNNDALVGKPGRGYWNKDVINLGNPPQCSCHQIPSTVMRQ